MTSPADADPAGLGRGALSRWLPVLWQAAADPPEVQLFKVTGTPGRFLLRVILSLPRVTIPAMLLSIVWLVGESAVPVVMGVAIDRALATGDAGQLALWLGVLAGLFLALTLAARLGNRLTAHALQLLQHRLRATLSMQVLHAPVGAAPAANDDIVSTMTNDVLRLSNAVQLVILPIARTVAIGFIAASLLATHWPLGVVVLIGAPVAVWLMGALSGRLSRDTREYQNLLAGTVGRAANLVAGYRVIKGVRAEAEATRRYRQTSREALVGARRNAGLLGRFLMGAGVVSGAFVALVTGLASWFAMDEQLSIGGLIAAVGLTQALLPQLQAIASASIPNLAGARAASARLLDVLKETRTVELGRRDAIQPEGEPDVPELCVVVRGRTIRVTPGEMVGIRADDRTAVLIIDALLNPQTAGDVEVQLDGRGARELPPADYRRRVTVAPHRVTLFSGTIRDNVDATGASELLEAAMHAAACDDFAIDLDGELGENGNRLSGGQRQRIALARALATNAPVLVLHDPTTAVDSVTEHTISHRLLELRRGHSTLLIASSPALLARCDHLVDLRRSEPVHDRIAAR